MYRKNHIHPVQLVGTMLDIHWLANGHQFIMVGSIHALKITKMISMFSLDCTVGQSKVRTLRTETEKKYFGREIEETQKKMIFF